MLKGLEVSEVRLSELERTSRIDSEFYKQENLNIQELLKKSDAQPLTDFVRVSDGNHMSISDNFCESGVPYYRGQDIHDFFIENANPVCIPESVFKLPTMMRSHLQKNDVLLSIVGTIGEVSLVNTNKDATCSCKLAILRPKADCNAEIIALFLQSKYGQNQIKKFIRGAVQMGFILEDVNQIYIPKFSTDFQVKIEQIVKSAHSKLAESKSLYAEAEEILHSELGLKGWQPKNENVSVKRLSDFASSGRLDAEYYQTKYDEIESKIKNGVYELLSKVVDIRDKNFNPRERTLYKYIELANIGSSGEITGYTEDYGENLPSRARRIIHTGDLLISSIEGSLQSCAIVTEDYDKALCSTGFYVASPKLMNAETLLILLKSDCIQSLLKKGCSGTILTAIAKEEFARIPVPLIKPETQELIAEKIQKSFDLRKQSKELLEQAKRMVEEEIEK